MKVTKRNVLDYVVKKSDFIYYFKFPDIEEVLKIELKGRLIYFSKDEKYGSQIRQEMDNELRKEAYDKYKQKKNTSNTYVRREGGNT